MSNTTQTIPFNFDDLFNESRYLFEQSGFDVSDGSNTSQLSAVMAYLISALNTNTALNINETLLPYATKRKNILQDARVLGYEIKHKTSYQYKISVRLSEKLCGYGAVTIPKYSYISANGRNYYYFGVMNENSAFASSDLKINFGSLSFDDKEILPSECVFYLNDEVTDDIFNATKVIYNDTEITNQWKNAIKIFNNNRNIELIVKEGELITFEQDVDSLTKTIGSITLNGSTYTRNFVDIPYNDVENDGIECYVSYFDDYGNYQSDIYYTKTENYFFESDGNENDLLTRKFLRLDDIEMNTPRIYFKYADMGNGVPFGSTVKFNILITNSVNGSMGDLEYETVEIDNENYLSYNGISFSKYNQGEYEDSFATDNNGISNIFDDCIITACDLIQSGTDAESNESIQTNAPKVYNSAYRLVTNLDYKNACNRSTYVQDSAVWGGEDEFPKSPGHIWFSFLPEKSSERSFTSNADNSEYQRDNSILEYNYQEGESKYQYALRQKYYQKNYILNTEIKSYSVYKDQSGTHKKYSGVWGDLENQYIPSLTFHHRHPIFLNFDYNFNILKYNIKKTTKEIHNTLFNVLDNCFYGEDSLQLEKFDTEYFHSNIVKRIDYAISDLCGFNSTVSNQLVLNEKTCCTENWNSDYKDIYIPLCVPFEKYFDNTGFLDIDRLPNIDTKKFINYKFDEIIPPTDDYPYSKVVNKYTDLRYSLVEGDLYVDWSNIRNDQESRRTEMNNQSNSTQITTDYSDMSSKIFVAPIKIDMTYKYYCSEKFLNSNENLIDLGFKLAPSNDIDESFKNITIKVYNTNYKPNEDNSSNLLYTYNYSNFGKDFDITKDRNQLIFYRKNLLQKGYIIEINFNRTCGFYYLFNSFKKEILIHLFVNGSYEGFKVAKNGMKSNEYYDHYLDEIREVWNKNEINLTDNDSYIDITYSSPRSYLVTAERRFLSNIEPTGEELETETHLFNYDANGLPSQRSKELKTLLENGNELDDIDLNSLSTETQDDRTDEDEVNDEVGHFLTTEGYLSYGDDLDTYTGSIVRTYNENMYLYTPLSLDLFRQNVYMNLKYNSENFNVHRNVIPRLNNVKFKNATEMY